MIYLLMHGRLGNQMFQYAFAKKIQENRKDNLALYFGKVKKNNGEDGWADDLQNFKVDHYKTLESYGFLISKTSLKQKVLLLLYLIRCRGLKDEKSLMDFQISMQPKLNKAGLYWIRNGKFTPVPSTEKNIFISGHFEDASLYDNMDEILRKQFVPKHPMINSNEELMTVIRSTESVCISIRRGDFLSKKNKDTYYLCDNNYFNRAIEIIKEKVKIPTLIFFSDDIDWVKDNFKYDGPVYYETPGNPVWEKIRLMAACKHFIISNSTFSWWVQYLSDNKDKVVISPNRWKNHSEYKGLIKESFIKVDV